MGGVGEELERCFCAKYGYLEQGSDRPEVITLITFVLSTERTGRDDKSKAKQSKAARSPYRRNIIDIDYSQCIFRPVLKLKPGICGANVIDMAQVLDGEFLKDETGSVETCCHKNTIRPSGEEIDCEVFRETLRS